MMGQTMMVKRTLVLLSVMVATLIAASGVALAVSKVCSSGTTQASPCSGTSYGDTLIGTSGVNYIKGLAGSDKISAGVGNDTTDGGSGNDTYSYNDGWGQDTLIDSGGSADALSFSAMGQNGSVHVQRSSEGGSNYVQGSNGEFVNMPSGPPIIEKITGSGGYDDLRTGPGVNTLQPGPGTGGASLEDYGGCPSEWCNGDIPASSDAYSGFAASGYGLVHIEDWGGTADKLVLPFASTDVYLEAVNQDNDQAADGLLILSSSTDSVHITGQLEPGYQGDGVQQKGCLETIQFTDTTMSIGSETAVQTLNAAYSLDASEREKRKKAARKVIEEEKKKDKEQKAQDSDTDQQAPSSSNEAKKR